MPKGYLCAGFGQKAQNRCRRAGDNLLKVRVLAKLEFELSATKTRFEVPPAIRRRNMTLLVQPGALTLRNPGGPNRRAAQALFVHPVHRVHRRLTNKKTTHLT